MGQKFLKAEQPQADNNKPLLVNASTIDKKQNPQEKQKKKQKDGKKSPQNQNQKKKSKRHNNQDKLNLQDEEVREFRQESVASIREVTEEDDDTKTPIIQRNDSLMMRTYVYNKLLHHPIELILNEEQTKKKNERTGKEEIIRSLKDPPLQVLDQQDKKERLPDKQDGLFYYMWQRPNIDKDGKKKKGSKKIRFMVCITVYSEDMESLLQTLDGVYKNLTSFRNAGICNEDIAVIVIFDGIDKMHESMSCFFNDFDKKMEVPATRRLVVRKNQFLKAIALENENPKTDREKQLMKIIENYEKEVTELRKKQLQSTCYNDDDQYYDHEIRPKLASLLQDLKEERFQPMADREKYLMVKVDDAIKDFHKLTRDKQKRYVEKKKMEIRKHPTYSSYCYQFNYQPDILLTNQEDEGQDQTDNFLKVFFNVKLINAGKLSSHMWFFRGYCEMFQPDYCALIDCGTIAESTALFKFFESMEGDKSIGGVCGYMGLIIEDIIDSETKKRKDAELYDHYDFLSKLLLNYFCVQKAQKFEYSIAHILDKSFESLFGFIQVLPGAFSAYRWDALKKKEHQKNILDEEYLASVLDSQFQMRDDYNIKKANMFLAEDRILCLEIFTKKNYILKYLPDAKCQTDAVNNFILLMKQRRRWINGSWFALDYVLSMFQQKIQRSHHSAFRALAFYACISFIKLQQIMQYLVIAFYFIFLNMTASNLLQPLYLEFIGPLASLYVLALFLYGCFVFYLFYFSLLCRRVEQRIYAFTFISTALGLLILLTYVYYILIMIKLFSGGFKKNLPPNLKWFNSLMIGLITVNLSSYAVPAIFYPQEAIFDIFMNVKDYIYFSPAYMHTLLIYAFSNINDLSWGTKGRDAEQTRDAILEKFLSYKITFVGKFLFMNILFIIIFGILTLSIGEVQRAFILFYAILFTMNLGIKGVTSILYSLKYKLDSYLARKYVRKQRNQYLKDSNNMKKYITDAIADMHNNIDLFQAKTSSIAYQQNQSQQQRNQSQFSNNELTPKSMFYKQPQEIKKFPVISITSPDQLGANKQMFDNAERTDSFQYVKQSPAQSFLYASEEQLNNQRSVSNIMKEDSRYTAQSQDFGVSDEDTKKNSLEFFMNQQNFLQDQPKKNFNIIIQEIQDESQEYSKNFNTSSVIKSEVKNQIHNLSPKTDQQKQDLNLNNSSNEWNEDLFEKQIQEIQKKNANLLKKNIQ